MGSGARRVTASLLAVVAITTWVAYGVFLGLPEVDEQGRSLLYVGYGNSRSWWSLLAFSFAATTTFVLLVWLLGRLVRRTSTRRRGLASFLAASLALASFGVLALVGVWTILFQATEAKQTLVQGMEEAAFVITEDAFDGDVVEVWKQVARFTYVREPGPTTVNPRSGPCTVVGNPSRAVLICGSTSQVLLGA